MQSSRRNFIKTSAVFVAGASLMPREIFASQKKLIRLGLQLYTVRDAMHTDPAGTLKKLSEAGFHHLEHAGYGNRKFYGYTVKQIKKLLDDNNLLMVSGHFTLSQKNWDAEKKEFTDK